MVVMMRTPKPRHLSRLSKAGASLLLALAPLLLGLTIALATAPARADDPPTEESEEKEESRPPSLGLPPGIPQVSALPGGFAPAYAASAEDQEAWGADFHGFVRMPLNIGINQRSGPATKDQYKTVLHASPRIPEYRDAFSYTSALADPYAQLNFGYGNNKVEATVIVQARSANTAMSFFDASTRGGIMGAFVTFHAPSLAERLSLQAHVGAFTNRYGVMGQYDEGRYGTPILGRTNGVGENVVALIRLKNFTLELQEGFQGLIDAAPLGIVPGDWNDYADPNIGTSLVHHYHLGVTYRDLITFGGHYMNAFCIDDRSNQGHTPDGKITIAGADMRLTAGRFGHLYLGVASTDARNSRSVGRVVEIMNGLGGPGLMRNYLGPNSNGTGQLLTFAGQYDLSIARLIYGSLFTGQSRDIVISLFGMLTQVTSDDRAYNNITKLKFGGEGSYSLLKWLATSVRVDEVTQDMRDNDKSFVVLSTRLILRTDWQARDQIVLQYSHWFNGNQVYVRSGSPAQYDPTVNPDENVVSLSASMWW
jgi:hypothetical protein